MCRMMLAGAVATLLLSASVAAQDNEPNNQVSMTPEIQAYLEHLAEYESPKQRVQRNAAFRSAQRRMRIAARNWYGVSLSRPMASPLPHMGTYSPMWSGTYTEPYLWLGYGRYGAYRISDRAFR